MRSVYLRSAARPPRCAGAAPHATTASSTSPPSRSAASASASPPRRPSISSNARRTFSSRSPCSPVGSQVKDITPSTRSASARACLSSVRGSTPTMRVKTLSAADLENAARPCTPPRPMRSHPVTAPPIFPPSLCISAWYSSPDTELATISSFLTITTESSCARCRTIPLIPRAAPPAHGGPALVPHGAALLRTLLARKGCAPPAGALDDATCWGAWPRRWGASRPDTPREGGTP
mmetsp:Transcript_46441/g.110647  ORF Transcript_46441/g.110647 Transcript_46441/m.110647 type:complete len:235 (+) Transcript_46441:582-1286(+)